MKVIALLFLLSTSTLYGQYLGGKEWTFTDDRALMITDVLPLADGTILIAGSLNHQDSVAALGVVIKTDAELNVLWSKKIKVGGSTHFTRVIQTYDGNFLVGGTSFYVNGNYGLTFYKIDSDGNVIWHKIISYTGQNLSSNSISGMYELSDSTLMVFNQPANIGISPQIFHLDHTGSILSKHQLTIENQGFLFGGDVCQGIGDIFYSLMLGYGNPTDGLHVYLTALSPDSVMWTKKYVFDGYADTRSISYLPNGHLVIAGSIITDTTSTTQYVPFVFQTDSDGNVVWAQAYNPIPPLFGYGSEIVGLSNSHFMLGGLQGIPADVKHILMEMDTNGQIEWTSAINDPQLYYANVTPLSDGRIFFNPSQSMDTAVVYILNESGHNSCTQTAHDMTPEDVGFQISTPDFQYIAGSNDIFIPDFQILDLAVNAADICATPNDVSKPDFDNSVRVFPNPSTGLFTIDFGENAIPATLHVFDIQGNGVKELFLTDSRSRLDLSDHAPGLYLIRIVYDGGVFTEKVVVR